MQKQLTTQQIDRSIARLALPSLGTLLAQPLLVAVDTTMIGRLGTTPLAGLSLATTIVSTIVGLCIFLAYATTAATARLVGAKQYHAALRQGIDGIWLGFGLGVVLGLLLFFASPLVLSWFGPSEDVLHEAIRYCRAAAFGLPAMLTTLATTGTLRGFADTTSPLIATTAGALANIPLNAILIYVAGWGIAGAGAGTAIAETVMAIFLLWRISRKNSELAKHGEMAKHGELGKNSELAGATPNGANARPVARHFAEASAAEASANADAPATNATADAPAADAYATNAAAADACATDAPDAVTGRRTTHAVSWLPSGAGVLKSLREALPLIVRTVSLRGALLLHIGAATALGTVPLAASQIVMTVWNFAAYGLDSLATAAQILVGQGIGTGNRSQVRLVLRRCLRWGLFVGLILGVVLALASVGIVHIMSTDADVRDLAMYTLWIACATLPIASVAYMLDGVLIGAGDTRKLARYMVIALLAFAPFTIVLMGPLAPWGNTGLLALWAAYALVFMGLRAWTMYRRSRGDGWICNP